MDKTVVTRQHIMTAARSYLGVRFRHQGRARTGIDCGGLIIRVCHDLGYHDDFHFDAYDRWPDGATLDALLDGHFDRVPRNSLTYGDIVLHADQKTPCHVGIVGDHGSVPPNKFSIIHAWLEVRKVTENSLERMKVLRAWRLRGVTE